MLIYETDEELTNRFSFGESRHARPTHEACRDVAHDPGTRALHLRFLHRREYSLFKQSIYKVGCWRM
jgi:hypothetical protein